jgi:hypothetical protein
MAKMRILHSFYKYRLGTDIGIALATQGRQITAHAPLKVRYFIFFGNFA